MKVKRANTMLFSLFFASGISGLIYQIVWVRMLSRIMGSTTYAVAIVVAAFMAGLALGSFIWGRYGDRSRRPLLLYARLELAVGVIALAVPWLLQAAVALYSFVHQMTEGSAAPVVLARVLILFVCIMIPAVFMGGTLPVLTAHLVREKKDFGASFSLLYGINTLGAVGGVLLAGYVTLGLWGERATILIGAGINFLVAAAAWYIVRSAAPEQPSEPGVRTVHPETGDTAISPYPAPVRRLVFAVFVVSGFTSLAYEVIWSRQLILFLKTSIYSFSMMLAIFLLGIALGSILIKRWVDHFRRPLAVFGLLEIVLALVSFLSLYLVVGLDRPRPETDFFSGYELLVAFILIFPLALVMGLIYPVACRCYVGIARSAGSSLGSFYAGNTLGNIAGSLTAGFFFIGVWGSAPSLVLLGAVNGVLGLVLIGAERGLHRVLRWAGAGLVLSVLALLIADRRGEDPFLRILENRVKAGALSWEIYLNKEGVEGTVTSFSRNGVPRLWVNGVGMTILCAETKLMAHLPLLLADSPRNILVICFGMGSTVASASLHPGLDITAVELVPEVYECFGFYHPGQEEILRRPNVHPLVGDGRNYFLLTSRTFDVITVDPAPPIYSAGTVNLYSREFLSLCRDHLSPGGVMCLWLPVSKEPIDVILSLVKTFHAVFPEMTVWGSPKKMGVYLIGGSRKIDVDRKLFKEKYLANPSIARDLVESTRKAWHTSVLKLMLWEPDLAGTADRLAPLITDDFPYTEFPFWRYLLRGKTPGMENGKILLPASAASEE